MLIISEQKRGLTYSADTQACAYNWCTVNRAINVIEQNNARFVGELQFAAIVG